MEQKQKVVLFDSHKSYENLLPLSYTRPVANFRVGIVTLREKWEYYIPGEYSFLTEGYLGEKFPIRVDEDEEALFISGDVIADGEIAESVKSLSAGEYLADTYGLVAWRGSLSELRVRKDDVAANMGSDVRRIKYVFDIFLKNPEAIAEDYRRLVRPGAGRRPDSTVTVIGPETTPDGLPSVYIEDGASVECAVLNVKDGPIYIGKDATVMEGACLRGPLALCEHSFIRMGARIYGGTTFGPFCKIGGEVDNSVVFGYSNKAHDGYLGNAVLGEWCNIGAGANSSNLKNDYSKIRIWNYALKSFMRTDLQFCGLIMGDHSKAGINCMFNTASVVGVGVNFHGCGYPRTFIPSFSTGSPEGGFTNVSVEAFMAIAGRVMQRRGIILDDVDRRLFERIYNSALRFKK